MVHEWALAESIVEYVLENRENSVVEKIVLKIGVLQTIDREILEYALNELFKMNKIIVEKIEFVEENILLKCRRCGFEWSIDMNSVDEYIRESIHFIPETIYSFFKCPSCSSRDFEIKTGRGIYIEEIRWKK